MPEQNSANTYLPASPRKRILSVKSLILVLILIGLSAAAFIGYNYFINTTSIVVTTQKASSDFYVTGIKLTKGGFIVFKALDKFGKPGQILAVSQYVTPGEYSDLFIPLLELSDRGNHQPKAGDLILVTIYEDKDSDNKLSTVKDIPAKDIFGRDILAKFFLN